MNNIEMEKHFELSEALVAHLLEEINLFMDTNDLIAADLFYVLNKLFICNCKSHEMSDATVEDALDHFKKNTLAILKKINEQK